VKKQLGNATLDWWGEGDVGHVDLPVAQSLYCDNSKSKSARAT